MVLPPAPRLPFKSSRWLNLTYAAAPFASAARIGADVVVADDDAGVGLDGFQGMVVHVVDSDVPGIDPLDAPFDPNRHEAVVHEATGEDTSTGQVVTEVLRRGYGWQGRILRPAMVKVRG